MFANAGDLDIFMKKFDEGAVLLNFDGTMVGDGMFIDSKYTKDIPRVIFPQASGKEYTILLYDRDAPYPSDPSKSPYVHFLGTLQNVAIQYSPMNPPADSPAHRYTLNIYEGAPTIAMVPPRHNFNVDVFAHNNNLKLAHSMTYYSKDPPSKDEALAPYPHNSMEDKYCRCVRDVKARGSRSGAYNPWAVCTKSVHRTGAVPCAGRGYD